MSRYQPYPNYKESGIEWLGEVPEHWEIKKFKYLAKIKNGQDQKAVLSDTGEYPIFGSGGEFGRASEYLYNKPSVLLGRKGTIDKPLFITEPFWTVDTMYYTQIHQNTFPKFFYYSCLTIEFDYYQFGSAVPSMTQENLHNIAFTKAPYKEQTAIANFLDREAAKIDTLIAKQERMIELLNEKRSALISHAVTKGLNPNAPMKDSGVEWLGEVPEHWGVYRIANLFGEAVEYGEVDWPILTVSIHHGVSDREFDAEEMDRKVARSEDRSKYKCVRENDLVYNMMRAWQGGFGAVTVNGLVSPAYVVARPKKIFSTRYVELLLRTSSAVEEMRRYSRGITDFRLRLYWSEFKNIQIVLPPINEANSILEYIDRQNKRIDRLIAKATQAIDLMKERRTALISAAVTGKIDVREIA